MLRLLKIVNCKTMLIQFGGGIFLIRLIKNTSEEVKTKLSIQGKSIDIAISMAVFAE